MGPSLLSAAGLCRLLCVSVLIFLGQVQGTRQDEQNPRLPRQAKTVIDCLTTKHIPLVSPSDKQYANLSSPYNLRIQHKPAVLVFPETTQHVSDAVLCAAQYQLKVQARSGGHSYGSYSTASGELIVDTQNFQHVSVDTESCVASFGAGVRLGNLELALQPYGRTLPHGTDSRIGAGGHFTMGGDGFTSRAWGLAIDSLVAMDVVLANGSLVHATAKAYPDVFFAMKGAGPSFGIATTFYAQTLPAPNVLTGLYLTWPDIGASAELSYAALKHFQDFANNASSGLDRRLQFDVSIDFTGIFNLKGVYLGGAAEFNKTVLPELLRGLPPVAAGDDDSATYIREYDWTAALLDANYDLPLRTPRPGDGGQKHTAMTDHDNFYLKSVRVPAPGLPDTALRNVFQWAHANRIPGNKLVVRRKPAVEWYITFGLQGGVDSQVFLPHKQQESAFWRRETTWIVENAGFVEDLDAGFPAAGLAQVNGMYARITKELAQGEYGQYVGYVDPGLSAEQAGRLYYGDVLFGKLKGLKAKIDPGNIFSNPQSIPVGS